MLGTDTNGADAILPRGTAAPGLPWVETARTPLAFGWRTLPTLSTELLWLDKRIPALDRAEIANALGDGSLDDLVPLAMPGRDSVVSNALGLRTNLQPRTLSLAYTTEAPGAAARVKQIAAALAAEGVSLLLP